MEPRVPSFHKTFAKHSKAHRRVSVISVLNVKFTSLNSSGVHILKGFLILIRSASNPMDKGACNSVYYQYYGQNSNMASSATMYIIGYIILTRKKDLQN